MQTDETKRLEGSEGNPLHEEPGGKKRNFKRLTGKLTMKRPNELERHHRANDSGQNAYNRVSTLLLECFHDCGEVKDLAIPRK